MVTVLMMILLLASVPNAAAEPLRVFVFCEEFSDGTRCGVTVKEVTRGCQELSNGLYLCTENPGGFGLGGAADPAKLCSDSPDGQCKPILCQPDVPVCVYVDLCPDGPERCWGVNVGFWQEDGQLCVSTIETPGADVKGCAAPPA